MVVSKMRSKCCWAEQPTGWCCAGESGNHRTRIDVSGVAGENGWNHAIRYGSLTLQRSISTLCLTLVIIFEGVFWINPVFWHFLRHVNKSHKREYTQWVAVITILYGFKLLLSQILKRV